ncbi:hypothetical protein [Glaciibacter sp. 2TAF33]|uniref:hypothetical protein n=1 Tax=Glaciibacter sp. 2TAF33 TaxID=3233015 RepID=UPI003F8EF9AD
MTRGTTAQARLARRLWETAQTDATVLMNLRAAYRGRHDLGDALWWRAHPLAPTPAGVPDPAVALRPLQDAVFSKSADSAASGQRAGKAAELIALAEELARDGADLDAVLDRFGDWATDPAEPPVGRHADRPSAHPVADPSAGYPDDGQPGQPDPPRHHAHSLLLAAAGAILGILAALGIQALQGEPESTDASAGSEAPAGYPQTRGAHAGSGAGGTGESGPTGTVLQVFLRPSIFPEGVVPNLGPGIEPGSIRPIALDAYHVGYQVYVARNAAGEYCLFLRSGSELTVSTCSDLPQLVQHGAWVQSTLRGVTNDADELSSTVTVRVTWDRDGSFRAQTYPPLARRDQPPPINRL